jgi:riboflavin synthase
MSVGLIFMQFLTGKHLIDVTVEEDEVVDEETL